MRELERTRIKCRHIRCRGENNRLILAELNNGDRVVVCKKCGSYYTRPFYTVIAENPGLGLEPEEFSSRRASYRRKQAILNAMSS